jgi:UDP-N-acetylmuramyl tripeptide synthase
MISVPFDLLAAAVPGARVLSRPPVLIRRLTADSRDARPGDLFACVRGRQVDGHRFALAAVRQGAGAVMLDRRVAGLDPGRTAQLWVPDVARALARLAPLFYNHPSRRLRLIGVTGTNGKTTVTFFTQAILEHGAGGKDLAPVGLLGTIAYDLGRERVSAPNTTPMAWEVQRRLQEMTERRCAAAVMEVSSHALVEGRAADCEFDVAVFTNLTPEHLDFHRTLAAGREGRSQMGRDQRRRPERRFHGPRGPRRPGADLQSRPARGRDRGAAATASVRKPLPPADPARIRGCRHPPARPA